MDKKEMNKLQTRFNTCSPIFVAMGDVIRQKLLLHIAHAGETGINVSELTSYSSLSRPAVSHHLKVLKDCGLIIPVKKGTQIFYKTNLKTHLLKINNFLTDVIAFIEKNFEQEKKES